MSLWNTYIHPWKHCGDSPSTACPPSILCPSATCQYWEVDQSFAFSTQPLCILTTFLIYMFPCSSGVLVLGQLRCKFKILSKGTLNQSVPKYMQKASCTHASSNRYTNKHCAENPDKRKLLGWKYVWGSSLSLECSEAMTRRPKVGTSV